MGRKNRYDASGLIEAQYEPGSRGRVLKNLLRIKRKREMDGVEAEAQSLALWKLLSLYDKNHRFTASDVCGIHKIWLEGIYQWAGRYRQVDLTKSSLTFASVRQIPRLMTEFEMGPLKKYTPCIFKSLNEVAEALAVVHVELILIHPFREGNGRTARLLSILMAAQAEFPVLDFGLIRGKRRKSYFAAVTAGLNRDYEPMKSVFRSIISGTLKFH